MAERDEREVKIEPKLTDKKGHGFCLHKYNGDGCEGHMLRFPNYSNQGPHYTCHKHVFITWGQITWWQIEKNMQYIGSDVYAPCPEGHKMIYNQVTRRKEMVKC